MSAFPVFGNERFQRTGFQLCFHGDVSHERSKHGCPDLRRKAVRLGSFRNPFILNYT